MNEQGRAARGSPAGGPPHNSPLCPLPRAGLALPLAGAEDWLARLDERLRGSPIREGFINRTHVQEACASLWLEGALVSLKDLVLRAPTHELTRAQAVLRTRRRIANSAPDWALSVEGLRALRGGPESRAEEGDEGRGEGSGDAEPERLGAGAGAGPLRAERAALGRALAKSTQILAGGKAAAKPLRDWFLDDPDDENERLETWRSAAAAASSEPPLPGGGSLVGRLGAKPAARAETLARQSVGFSVFSGAGKNKIAPFSFVLGPAPYPARKTPRTEGRGSRPFSRQSRRGRRRASKRTTGSSLSGKVLRPSLRRRAGLRGCRLWST